MAFYKNVAGQQVSFLALDSSLDPLSGDAANITAKIKVGSGASASTNDANPSEDSATDHPGVYTFDLTAAETNADKVTITPASSTAGVTFEPRSVVIYPTPGANTGIHSDVRLFKGSAPGDLVDTDKIPASVQHIPDGAFTAAKFGANFLTAAGISQDAGEEIAAIVEEFIVNDGDATAVMQAIADKIAADWVAGDASPLAIVAALKADSEWTDLSALAAVQTALDYANAIWVDSDGGTDDDTYGEVGKRSAPCKTWANVVSLLGQSGFSDVRVVSGVFPYLEINSIPVGFTTIHLPPNAQLGTGTPVVLPASAAFFTVIGGLATLLRLSRTAGSHSITVRDSRQAYVECNGLLSSLIIMDSEVDEVILTNGSSLSTTQIINCRPLRHNGDISQTTGHCHILGWNGEGTIDATGTGHFHFVGRSDALTIEGTSGSVHLTGEIKYTDNSAGAVTVDKSGITAKEGVDGDTLETLSDQIDGVATEANATANKQEILTVGSTGPWTTGAGGGGSTGDGTDVTVVSVDDGVDPIPQASVWVSTDSLGASVVAFATTNDAGEVSFLLNHGLTYYLWVRKVGYGHVVGTPVVAAAAHSVTLVIAVVPTVYCQRADLEIVYGVSNIKQWASTDNDANAAKIQARIDWACEAAYDYINERLLLGDNSVPISPVYRNLVTMSAMLAGVILYESRGVGDVDPMSGRPVHRLKFARDRVDGWIRASQTGLRSLGGDPADHSPFVSNQ
jgi:hypothetical protein